MHHFKSIGEFKLELQSRNAQFGSKLAIFVPCDIETWWMTLENNKSPLLHDVKLCASFQSHGWIQIGVTVPKHSIRVKGAIVCSAWPWKLMDDIENHRAPHLCGFKLCASFHSHRWIPIVVTARKRPIVVKISDFFCTVWPSNLTNDPPKQ